jgi:hypothetical protein
MTPEIVETDPARYDQIEGEAYERYLLEVIRGSAAEEERLGNVGRRSIKDVRLVGDAYPHWGFEVDTVNPQNGKEGTSKFSFRGNPSLFDAERPRGRTLGSQIIGDLLMHIREGG